MRTSHENQQKILDFIKAEIADKGYPPSVRELCAAFNTETKDGRDMREISALLDDAIHSIMDTKEESDIDSLFSAGGTTALLSEVSGLDDFELICFLVVK